MDILSNYIPTVTNLDKKELSTYIRGIKGQLSPEILEMLIDITVEFDTEIRQKIADSPRRDVYDKICSIFDGEIVSC